MQDLYERACSGDKSTITYWHDIWLKNYGATFERFKGFGEHSIGRLHLSANNKPCIVIGSGPSLTQSLEALKKNGESPNPVTTVSCLHNFGLFQDKGIECTYYLTLDAGDIVLKDVYEGREHEPEWYWERTKGKKLFAHVCTPPALFEKWQGEVYLFATMVPDAGMMQEFNKIERFAHYISCGGNALGGCMYAAKMVLGCNPIIYVGADFCFSYDNHFHSYATQTYDALGNYVPWPDVFGNMRKTWASYLNFKFYFDHVAVKVPGIWINASEGILGAYREGNIRQFKYQTLEEALTPYRMAETLYLQTMDNGKEVKKEPIAMAEVWKDSKHPMDLVAF